MPLAMSEPKLLGMDPLRSVFEQFYIVKQTIRQLKKKKLLTIVTLNLRNVLK